MKQKVEHTTFRNQKLFCLNCGAEFNIPFPIAIPEMTKKIDAFNVLHKDCEKTWTEPGCRPKQRRKRKGYVLDGNR